MFDFDEIVPREGTDSIKFCDPKRINENSIPGTIPMWIADMDFRCAPVITKALHERVDAGIFGYSEAGSGYFDALEGWYRTRYGIEIDRGTVVMTAGVVTAIDSLTKLLTREGEGVIIMTPSYGPFSGAISKVEGRTALYNRLVMKDGVFTIDFEDLEKKASDPSAVLLILCNPHNPTGRVWTREELTEIISICRKNGVKIISDEIHSDITRTGVSVTSMLSMDCDDVLAAVCTAPSKTFNMAGNGLSNIIVKDPDLRKALAGSSHSMPSPFSLAATKAAYSGGAEWVDAMRAYLDENFRILSDFLSRELPECVFTVPGATYLAWVDMSAYGLGNRELEDLFASHGVLIEAGGSFVDNADGFVRINIACPASVLREALERIRTALHTVKR